MSKRMICASHLAAFKNQKRPVTLTNDQGCSFCWRYGKRKIATKKTMTEILARMDAVLKGRKI